MFFILSLLMACQHDNPLPIFSETQTITIQPEAQQVRLQEVIAATKRAWLEGDKAQAQLIFQSYYVNEFRDVVPQLQALGVEEIAQAQYDAGIFIVDIPNIEVSTKFESRLRTQSEQLNALFEAIPVAIPNAGAVSQSVSTTL